MRKFKEVTEEKRRTTGEVVKPRRGTKFSAGYDFIVPMCYDKLVIRSGACGTIWSDIKAHMEDDEVLMLYIRSSKAIKEDLQLKNGTGVIDSDYADNLSNDGNIGICIWNCGEEDYVLKGGEKIAQGVFMKYLTVDEEDEIIFKREGGIGSTGE